MSEKAELTEMRDDLDILSSRSCHDREADRRRSIGWLRCVRSKTKSGKEENAGRRGIIGPVEEPYIRCPITQLLI